MSVIFHVLKEEYERLSEAEGSYSRAIASMPRGAPRIRQVRKRKYLYLEYRRGSRVVHEYIGPENTEKARNVLEQIEQRRRYEKLLRQTKDSLKDVRKALRGKI